MSQRLESGFRDWYLRRIAGSFAITTSASTADVQEACQRWARALGWTQIDSGPGGLIFRPSWLLWTFSGFEMQVSKWEVDGKTEVRFLASAHLMMPGAQDDLGEAARRFAEGVELELREAGFVVEGTWEQLRPSVRARLERMERWRRRFTLFASILLIPASVAVWLLTGEAAVGFFAGLWIALAILTGEEVVRRRLLGMKAMTFVVIVAALWTAVVVVLTPIFVAMALGKI